MFYESTASQRRSEEGAGGAGRTGRHLLGAANGRKLKIKFLCKLSFNSAADVAAVDCEVGVY